MRELVKSRPGHYSARPVGEIGRRSHRTTRRGVDTSTNGRDNRAAKSSANRRAVAKSGWVATGVSSRPGSQRLTWYSGRPPPPVRVPPWAEVLKQLSRTSAWSEMDSGAFSLCQMRKRHWVVTVRSVGSTRVIFRTRRHAAPSRNMTAPMRANSEVKMMGPGPCASRNITPLNARKNVPSNASTAPNTSWKPERALNSSGS